MTQREALDWIGKLFEEPPGRLSPDMRRGDIAAWDSLGVLTLMASLDEEFGIVLADEQLQEIHNVDDILNILRKGGRLE